jgi:hypothetical protein
MLLKLVYSGQLGRAVVGSNRLREIAWRSSLAALTMTYLMIRRYSGSLQLIVGRLRPVMRRSRRTSAR